MSGFRKASKLFVLGTLASCNHWMGNPQSNEKVFNQVIESKSSVDVLVYNGSGSGTFSPNSQIEIKAQIPEDMKFKNWEVVGEADDNIHIESLVSAETILTLGNSSVELRAHFTDLEDQELHQLDVRGGSGSGYYRAGESVQVQLNDSISNEDFLEWQLDSSLVFSPSEKSEKIVLTMPNHMASVEALYLSDDSRSVSLMSSSSANVSSGFLWKPVSDNDRKLVVLLPSSFANKVNSVTVNGERGRFSSIANGGRPHYRFSKPGSGYGRSATVVVNSRFGKYVYRISNTSTRQSNIRPTRQ